ncbi:nicotinate phosphoribosyltransferase [Ostertagia ostertagi]
MMGYNTLCFITQLLSDIDFIKKLLPADCNPNFFEYLAQMDCSSLKIKAIPEGSAVFPKTPLITVEGPLAICQLLETTFLNLINFASLMATNASRFRQAAGDKAQMLEFGLRRAQGPNGGLTASKYSYIGGMDLMQPAMFLPENFFGIPVKGTQAHSFVCSFSSADDLKVRLLRDSRGLIEYDLYSLSVEKRRWIMEKLEWGVVESEVSNGELAAFVAYAIAFPSANLSLIDTYDVLRSGVINFIAVALALFELGYKTLAFRDPALDWVENITIVASNDINEETIMSLNEQSHEIDAFGVGTHLVTCQKQPALGCVYKLVALSGHPKIKLSQEVSKITIPGRKKCFRLFGKTGYAILDLMMLEEEDIEKSRSWSKEGFAYLGKTGYAIQSDLDDVGRGRSDAKANQQNPFGHPVQESKRALVVASRIEPLHEVFWCDGKITKELPDLKTIKARVNSSLDALRKDHRRYLNPTPYKVSVSEKLYDFLHSLWLQNAPIGQLE